jgi:cytochrome P450
MDALFTHPVERALLTADLGLLSTAIEQMLRWTNPVIYMRRTATAETELGGRRIEAGQKVVMYYGAANRDPRAFDEPEHFDITPRSNDHLAFGGGGPHFCLGSHVARVEIDAMFRQLLAQLPDLQKAGDTEWQPSSLSPAPSTSECAAAASEPGSARIITWMHCGTRARRSARRVDHRRN